MSNKSHNDNEWLYRILKPEKSLFISLTHKPCRIEKEENGEETVINCLKEEATFWSVYINTLTNEELTIADCKNEESALKFIDWLNHLLDYYALD